MKKDRGNRPSVLFAAMHLETVHIADRYIHIIFAASHTQPAQIMPHQKGGKALPD